MNILDDVGHVRPRITCLCSTCLPMSNQARPVLFTNMQMRARKRRRIHRCKACRREEAGISYEKTNGNGWGKPYVFDLMSFFMKKESSLENPGLETKSTCTSVWK